MSTNAFTRESPCETCGLMICLCLSDDLESRRAPEGDELANQLAASVAILESSDKAWLRRVIHLAEGRIMDIEDKKEATPRLDDAAANRATKNEWQEYEARGRRGRDKYTSLPPECSICRRRHGLEIIHECE